ncbi:MAG: purine-nucleoside phosphorylase [Clostridia bacterium]|nr:purine-nucleoside phosphorylase [Clostridia bacterium]
MSNIPTPHINAKKEDIADVVLMPGDPLRAKFIAENFLTEVKCFNTVRNMLGFTGKYGEKTVSVMGSGMGMPSIGIYSYELYNFYDVQAIIRIGSAGALQDYINLEDIVLAMGACTDSNYCGQYGLNGTFSPIADYNLLKKAEENSKKLSVNTFVGNICSSDVFYDSSESLQKWKDMGVLAAEMEAAALYVNAARANKKALCILTVSDCLLKGLSLSSEKRQLGFSNMVKLALDTAAGK